MMTIKMHFKTAEIQKHNLTMLQSPEHYYFIRFALGTIKQSKWSMVFTQGKKGRVKGLIKFAFVAHD